MAYTEILTGDVVTAEQFSQDVFQTYVRNLWWKNMMGESTESVIQVKEDLTKKSGDAITVNLVGEMEGGLVLGNAVGLGNEGSVPFFGQRITIDNVRHLVRIDDVPMTQKRVGFRVAPEVKHQLIYKSQKRLDDEITTALSDVTNARVRGRYLYGAADSNWNATHATALTNIDNTADKLTTNMIRIAKRKAIVLSNATAKIRPTKVVNGKNMESWFVFVGHTYSLRDMFDDDAAWKNAQLNIPPRSNDSPIFTGSSFKGAYDGVLIYEYEAINLVASTIQVSHNFLLGAQAAAVVWGQRSKVGEEEQDLGHRITYETHEIRGVSKLYFNRATPEDHGYVHVFAAAVAD